ncbi:MAG: diacylglycerol/lipid kinase family protein, partial [Candidatus Nanopelagicales bacterium]
MSHPPASASSPSSPSLRRRLLAILSLVSMAIVVALVVLFLLQQPLWLVGGLIGLGLVGSGGWWLITEQNPRRSIGIAGIAAGVLVMAASVFKAYADSDGGVWRLGVLLAALVLAVSTARAALVRELHEIDQLRAGRVRPQHPVLICNPKSGGGKVQSFGLIEQANDMGIKVVLLEPGLDLAQLARDAIASGADCLGMAGGDGSQALVASIAIENNIPFVCISAGTRNHFALDLGLDRTDPRKGMVALRDGVERRVDYATVGDRLFVNNVSLGIYATIVQEDEYRDAKVETTKARLPEMLGRQAEPFDLQFTTPDGQSVDGAFLIMVSNNPYVLGPSLDISQRRAMDTGRLGVVAVNAATGADAAKLVASATFGLGKRNPNMHQFEATSFEVRSRSGHALAGVDGESLDLPTPLQFRSHPGGMRLLVPPDDVLAAEQRRARAVN